MSDPVSQINAMLDDLNANSAEVRAHVNRGDWDAAWRNLSNLHVAAGQVLICLSYAAGGERFRTIMRAKKS